MQRSLYWVIPGMPFEHKQDDRVEFSGEVINCGKYVLPGLCRISL
ncbi:hypothetical protein BCL69_10883 [Nitrosomonas communis]|uniref:Uncharacterized protein n=1 Tax=Nitrosomonas communis TaxID=44574 RepID=A0A5D3Y9S8_9PROT|nr:hypothetical protein BCL69_10883 [Nitrosomonas communis]